VFDAHPETVFIDVCHVSEEGNAILADSLLTILEAGSRSRDRGQ